MTMTEETVTTVTMQSSDFRDVASLAHFATTDNARIMLTAVKVTLGNGEITATATDSYRLGRITRAFEGNESGDYLVPAKFLLECLKACARTRGLILIKFTEDEISVTIDGVTRTTRPEIGEYPKVDQLWPSGDGSPAVSMALDVTFLASFSKLAFVDKNHSALCFTLFGDGDKVTRPVKITVNQVPGFEALLMPISIR